LLLYLQLRVNGFRVITACVITESVCATIFALLLMAPIACCVDVPAVQLHQE